ncbi:mRNA export factor Gle1 [Stomoxys calcitrans]|uniref:mRNA export factor GLE1 n=1 Tax=Stomoxys calcitrans TaxID=35570 RepID=A0A1I8QA56_STOCA|nr:mRNA export factor Gle1 [Stomoxys calcitrans]
MIAQKVVEDALNEVKKIHETTLEHAVQLSICPLLGGRSIGSDIKNDSKIGQTRDFNKEEEEKQMPAKEHVKRKETSPLSNISDFNSLQNLDFQTINSSILLREADERRKRSMWQQMFEMKEKHLATMEACQKPIEAQKQEERRKWLEKKRLNDKQILKKAEQQSALELKESERQLENLRKQTQRQLQLVSFQGISQYQSQFRSKYESIVGLLMSIDKSALMSCNEYNQKLKEFIRMFEQLIAKIKCGDCGAAEMKTAENLCKSLSDLEANVLDALRKENERQEALLREANSKENVQPNTAVEVLTDPSPNMSDTQSVQINAVAENTITPKDSSSQSYSTVPAENKPSNAIEEQLTISRQYVSPECFEFYTKIITFYQEKVERVKVLQSDDSMKKYRFDCQKSINIPVNAISAVSPQHLQDKFDKLYTFVTSQPALGRDYCVLLMAKKFVGQGETTISSNPQAAFPVASVIVSLWKQIPEFGQLFLAYCFKECPFLVPYFIPQKKDQSPEEYSKVLGFRIVDGQPEKQDMYLKRQSGIARLYAAVMVTNGRQKDGPLHPYSLENAWRWLTNMVEITPLPHLSATLIMEILQIVGSELWSHYGKQFVKLIVYIQQYYFPTLSEVDAGGPKARLELLLNNFLREGQMPKPSGMLPPGFW